MILIHMNFAKNKEPPFPKDGFQPDNEEEESEDQCILSILHYCVFFQERNTDFDIFQIWNGKVNTHE